MRLGTTLCLHLNNPRARGYAYPRDFVPDYYPTLHTTTLALYRVRLSRVHSAFACLFPRGNGKHIIPHRHGHERK